MIHVFLHSALIYILLVVLMRVIGKRQLGELELSELIVTILISETAAAPIVDPDTPVWTVFVPILTLMGLEYLLSLLSMKSVKFRALITGKPALLMVRGRIDQTQMRKNRITPDELTEALRAHGVLDLAEVEYAILETNGAISVIPAPDQRPVTAGQMGVTGRDAGYPVIVVNNGRVLSDNLRLLGRDERWLKKQLAAAGLSGPGEVFMMTADMTGGVFLAPREER